jgi:hypothetical protein
MRSAATTMLRLAALHLPSPLDFQARRFAKLMRGGAMSGLCLRYFCTNEASLKRAAV